MISALIGIFDSIDSIRSGVIIISDSEVALNLLYLQQYRLIVVVGALQGGVQPCRG